MKYLLGIDLGTSYFKAGIYDEALNLKGIGRVCVEKFHGNGTLCELSSESFASLVKECINQACKNAEISPVQIKAIGYSSQANSFILLDKQNQPLTPMILWPDNRAKTIHPNVMQIWNEKEFLQKTAIGIEPSHQFCINKLLWFRQNTPAIWNRTATIMTISDYLVYLLTGKKAGDMGTASLLALMDCRTGKWWDKAFDILEIDQQLLAPRFAVGTKIGQANSDFAASVGLKPDTSFYLGSLDHHIAALGAGLGKNADISESTGTVLACVNFNDRYAPQKNICISPWKDGKFCQLVFNENGASSLEWYQKKFASEYSIEELITMAEKSASSGGLTAKPAAFKYASREEAFCGISSKHTHGNFIYALMESVAKTLNELIYQLNPHKEHLKITATGGGAKSDLWIEIKQKITGCKFCKIQVPEPATLGAAILCTGTDK